MALPVAGGAAAALGLLALFALRRRRQDQALQAANAEGAPSQFDEAQGQTVDTHEDAPVSSMMYSPSQLDAGGDVDPVAEADVYLAYGRDKQAEEILQEALRLHPERLAVRAKLLEIYAQRGDVGAYNTEAQTLYDLTLGEGPEWAAARDGGLTLDPDNPLYRGGAVAAVQGPDSLSPQEGLASQPPDLDLSLGESQAAPSTTETDSRAVGSFEIEAENRPQRSRSRSTSTSRSRAKTHRPNRRWTSNSTSTNSRHLRTRQRHPPPRPARPLVPMPSNSTWT